MRGHYFLGTTLLIATVVAGLFGGQVVEFAGGAPSPGTQFLYDALDFGYAEHMTQEPDGDEDEDAAAAEDPGTCQEDIDDEDDDVETFVGKAPGAQDSPLEAYAGTEFSSF